MNAEDILFENGSVASEGEFPRAAQKRSAEPVSDQTSMGAYYGCPGANGAATLITPTDQYLRRTYSTTVELRNRAL
mgnify:CR=1 FL=1